MPKQSVLAAPAALAVAAPAWLFAGGLGGCASRSSHIVVVPEPAAAQVSPGTLGEARVSPEGRMAVVLGAGDELGWRLHQAGR